MASFSDLPVELTTHIISFVPLPSQLARVSLVCRKLEKITQPFLYHTFVSAEYALHGRPFSRRIRPFFRTVVQRPDLARLVKSVAIEAWTPEAGTPIPEQDLPFYRDVVDGLEWAPGQFKMGTMRRLSNDDDLSIEDTEIALLVFMLPNLRELSLEAAFSGGAQVTAGRCFSAVKSHNHCVRPLQQLKYFSIESDDPKRGWNTHMHFMYSFANRCVTTLEWVRPNFISQDVEPAHPSALAIKGINDLRLHGAQMSAAWLSEVLTPCEGLKAFWYTFDSLEPGENFLPRDAAEVLLRLHGSTLEHLTLDLNEDAPKRSWQHAPPERLYLGDFRGFERLKTLRVGQQSLLGLLHAPYTGFGLGRAAPSEVRAVPGVPPLPDMLPQSLEALEVRYCDMRCVPDIALLLGKAENGLGFPALREVTVLCAEESTRKKGAKQMLVLEQLERMSEEEGRKVKLDVRYEGRAEREKRRFPVDSVNVWRGSRIRYPRWERRGL